MKILFQFLRILLALFFCYAGIQHFIKPQFYEPFVPSFLPFKEAIVYVSGILELLFGLLLLIPKYAKLGATGILLLLLIFLPVHVWDVFAENPAIGSQKAAYVRLPFQFLFIAWAYGVGRFIS